MLAMETQQQAELAGARSEKEQLQRVLSRQSGAIAELEKSLAATSTNASLLQRQQLQLLEAVQRLVRLVTQGRGEPGRAGRAQAGCRQGVGSDIAPHPPERVLGHCASPHAWLRCR